MEGLARRQEAFRGFRAGIPVAVGYLPMAMAFGVLATQAGLSPLQASAMSLVVYAGASQYAALGMVAGGSAAAIVLATLVLNFRHFLMSMSLSRRLPLPRPGSAARGPLGIHGLPWAVGFWITDETFVVASLDGRLTPWFFLGLGATAYASWVSGTVIGAAFSSLIPPVVARGMGVALYAMFVAMLVPGVKAGWLNGAVAVVGGALSWAAMKLVPGLPGGWRIVVAILLASALGAAFSRGSGTADGAQEAAP